MVTPGATPSRGIIPDMAKPSIIAITLNGNGRSDFKLPDVHAADPLNVPLFPDRNYFDRPADMVAGQKMMIRLDPEADFFGQVFGYVAPKGQCILDTDPNSCWMVPPSPTNYEYAHQGSTILADATLLPTANIGGAGGHAPHEMGWSQVPRYYEDISTQMARLRYGEDEFGVYGVGIAVPTLTWGGAVSMIASATSGDWRWVDELGAWDFMGSCFVNLPGLPLHAKSGTRLARKASATPLGDKVMIVTMSGSIEPDTEVDMGASCDNCKSAAEAAKSASTDTALGLTGEDVDARIAAALADRDTQWEAKLGEAIGTHLTPVLDRLTSVEAISLSVLDGA